MFEDLPAHKLLQEYLLADLLQRRPEGWIGQIARWFRAGVVSPGQFREIAAVRSDLAGPAAEALFRGLGDGHLLAGGEVRAAEALALLEAHAISTDITAEGWIVMLRIALGRAGEADWRRLTRLPVPVASAQLWQIVRAWMPLHECGSLPTGASVEQLLRFIRGQLAEQPDDANLGHLAVFADVCFGGSVAAPELADHAARRSRKERAFLSIVGWLAGREEWATAMFGTLRDDVPATEAAENFYYGTAGLLSGPIATRERWRARIEMAEEKLFEPARPSHVRCFLQALNWAVLGDALEAQRWRRRALAEDPAAAVRGGAWRRACRRGGISPEV